MDIAGLTGFSSRTFLRSLPWREHTWEVALLLEVVGGVGSVNTRLASVTRKSSSPLAWMIIVTFLCLDICWHSCSIAESPAKPIENRRRAQSGNHDRPRIGEYTWSTPILSLFFLYLLFISSVTFLWLYTVHCTKQFKKLGLNAPANQCTDATFSANHMQSYKPIAIFQDLKSIYQDLRKIIAEFAGLL